MHPSTIPAAHGVILVLGGAAVIFGSSPDPDGEPFEAPVQLHSGEAAMGSEIRYPSPHVLDFNGDGVKEMIVGDLTGAVRVAHPMAGDDDVAWGELAPLTTDGRELKFHNW